MQMRAISSTRRRMAIRYRLLALFFGRKWPFLGDFGPGRNLRPKSPQAENPV